MEKQVDFDRKVVGQVNVDSEDTSLWKSVLQKAVRRGMAEKEHARQLLKECEESRLYLTSHRPFPRTRKMGHPFLRIEEKRVYPTMADRMKALIIQMPFEVDLHNVTQVARATMNNRTSF